MPLEFTSPALRKRRKVNDFANGRLPAGSITDDTEMAIALWRSLQRKGTHDSRDVAGEYLNWLHSMPLAVGRWTSETLTAIGENEDRSPEEISLELWRKSGGVNAANGIADASGAAALDGRAR